MARKHRNSLLNSLLEFAKSLPTWLSAALALFSYIVFHQFATMEIDAPSAGSHVFSSYLPTTLLRSASVGLQYLIPFVLGIGCITALFKARKGRRLADDYSPGTFSQNPKPAPARSHQRQSSPIDWLDFELLVGETFRRRGYQVTDGGEPGADGGVDVVLKKSGKTYLVQCKHWKTQRVGVAVVRELLGAITASKAAGGFIVTSGAFTSDAVTFARENHIKLIDGNQLDGTLRNPSPIGYPTKKPKIGPTCPRCSSSMVRRVATKGNNKGNEFWGCSRFPQCRGITNF